MRIARSGSPNSDAIWSSRPVCAPTQSFSTREHRRARSRRSGGATSATASRARHSATSSAADEDSPEPRGTVPVISSRAPDQRTPGGAELADGAAGEGPPAGDGGDGVQGEGVVGVEVGGHDLETAVVGCASPAP